MPASKKSTSTPVQQSTQPGATSSQLNASSSTSENLNCGDNLVVLIDKITTNFTSSFQLCVDRIMDALDKKLTLRMDTQSAELFELHKKVDVLERNNKSLEKANDQLNEKIAQLNSKIDALSTTVDDLDQYSRNQNLLIHGISHTATHNEPERNLSQYVAQLITTNMGITVNESDINTAHRIGRPTSGGRNDRQGGINTGLSDGATNSSTGNVKHQPIIIQLNNRKLRDQILHHRRVLKGKGFTITEQLTTRKAQLLKKCTDLTHENRLKGSWSAEGKILIKTLNDRTLTVTSELDLAGY